MKKKLAMIAVMIMLCLTGCGNTGVSQVEYDRVVAEKEALEEKISGLEESSTAENTEKKENFKQYLRPIRYFRRCSYC